MNTNQIRLVYLKEMMDTLRDRRTLISMIVVPMVVIPALILGMGKTIRRIVEGARKEKMSVMILGAENAPTLAAQIMRHSSFEIVPPDTAFTTRIENKKLRAAVEFPADFEAALPSAAGTSAPTVNIYFHDSEIRSELARRNVETVLETYLTQIVEERLAARDLSSADLQPFQHRSHNVASSERVGGEAFGGFIPYIIILLTMMGAMYPAIDVTAGEKERGTIETILASPVSRTSLALGKFFAVVTAAVTTALLALVSLAVSSRIATADAGDQGFSMLAVPLSATNAAAMLLMVFPVAVLFSGTLLAIALMAKTYKEAQSYISPLNIVVIIPAVSSLFPGIDLDLRLSLIPILNVSLASKQIIAGIYEWKWIGLIFASSCVYAAVALAVAVSFFKRESVLFRT
jgi:sodium transport system permease protein